VVRPAAGIGRDEQLDAAIGDPLNMLAVPVAGVGQQHLGQLVNAGPSKLALRSVEHRLSCACRCARTS
jgi:hypothetical protein